MAIYNLGQLQEYDVGSGISEALSRFSEGQQKRNLLERQHQQRKEESILDAKTRLGIAEMDKADQNTKWGRSIVQAFWTKMDKGDINATIQNAKNFETSEHGKELVTLLKDVYPQGLDEEGHVRYIPPEKEAPEWSPKSEQEKLAFLERSEKIKAKIRAGEPLNAGDAVQLMKAADVAFQNGAIDEKEYQDIVNKAKTRVQQLGFTESSEVNPLTDSLNPTLSPNATPISQEATPRKTRFKVKRLP